MNNFLTALTEEDNYTVTENGAVALRSTGDYMLDAFGSMGSMMKCPEETIIRTFSKAYSEEPELAIKYLFYLRDVRGGQGLRRAFRICLRWLANLNPDIVVANLPNILFYGRGDDYMCLFGTSVEKDMVECVRATLFNDYTAIENGHAPSLLAKWLPSESSHNVEVRNNARKLATMLGATSKEYRKMLSELRNAIGIVETKMSNKEWGDISYESLPSKASMKYTEAFFRHDEKRYTKYLKNVAEGKAKINAGALFPVDIMHKIISLIPIYAYYRTSTTVKLSDRYLLDGMWKALPNFYGDSTETGICVVDTSVSMDGTPVEVALSLGMYCADKCRGPFKDHFITFSNTPHLVKLTGTDIIEKYRNINTDDWGQSTNLEAVFDLILNTGLNHHIKDEDMPKKLYIISDMQMNEATGRRNNSTTFMQTMKQKYINAGYTMPTIVYWNVRASRCGMFQDTYGGENCCMVSGYSPSLFKAVIDGTEYVEEVKDGVKSITQKVDPIHVMLTTLNNERYTRVVTRLS